MGELKYPLASDSFDHEEINTAIDVLKSGRYTMGEKVRQFETELAAWLGVKHCVMVNSGSSANLLLVDSLIRRYHRHLARLKPGDEVLVPALAWPTTVWPLVQLGLVPVFVDVDPETMAISLESAAKTVSPKTKGMFLIHVLGQACNMNPYVEFCVAHNIVLFEDCCESFAAYDGGKHVGSFGAGGTLSHFFSHHLTTIEGGTIITNDDEHANDLRSARAHGWVRDRSDRDAIAAKNPEFDQRFLFVMPGYNVRPTDLQAAIGLIQLKKMDQFLARREEIARYTLTLMQKYAPWMRMPGSRHLAKKSQHRSERQHSWMNIPFILERYAPMRLAEVKAIFEQNGVETRPIIAGNLARHPASREIISRSAEDLRASDTLLERGFMIGCHPNQSSEAVGLIEKAFKAIF